MRILAASVACSAALLLYSHAAMADHSHSAMVYYPPTANNVVYVNTDSIRIFKDSYKTALVLEVYKAPEMGAKYSVLNMTVNCDSRSNSVSQIFYSSSNVAVKTNHETSEYASDSNPVKYICMTDTERSQASGSASFWKMAPDTDALIEVANQVFQEAATAPIDAATTKSPQLPAHQDANGGISEIPKVVAGIAVLSIGSLLSYIDLDEPLLWLGALACLMFTLAITLLLVRKLRN